MPAFLFMLWVGIVGPGILDHGFEKIKAEGFKPAIVKALHEAKSLKADKLGNYGND